MPSPLRVQQMPFFPSACVNCRNGGPGIDLQIDLGPPHGHLYLCDTCVNGMTVAMGGQVASDAATRQRLLEQQIEETGRVREERDYARANRMVPFAQVELLVARLEAERQATTDAVDPEPVPEPEPEVEVPERGGHRLGRRR